MLGTRATLAVDCTYAMTLLAPAASWVSFRLSRARRHDVHRKIQIGVLGLCVVSVVAFETSIRLSGGSGAFLSQAPHALASAARALLMTHITAAVLTYVVWAYLAIVSSARYRRTLPGSFSSRHKRLGKLVFSGLCFTAASATGMYVLAFVA
jgi:putative membrane protein